MREEGIAAEESTEDYIISFSEDDTRAMSNFMLRNRFLIADGALWGTNFAASADENETICEPKICRMDFSTANDGALFEEMKVIAEQVDVEFLTLGGDYIYCLVTAMNSGETSIARIYIPTHGFEILYTGGCDTLQLFQNKLYFSDLNGRFKSMNTDGSGVEDVLGEREVYYPYIISNEWMCFQDGKDESLKLHHLPSGYEVQISDGRVFEYVINGSILYFSKVEQGSGMKGRLFRTNLNDFFKSFSAASPPKSFSFVTESSDKNTGTRFSINGDHINGSNYKTYKIKNWKLLDDRQYEIGYISACQYVGGDYEVFYDYEKEDIIDKIAVYRTVDGKNVYLPRLS